MDHRGCKQDDTSQLLATDQPSIARIYDYTLGGSANFEVDRIAAEELMRGFPGQRAYAYANRHFLRRAVTVLTNSGFDQFLDLGSGIPTAGNVHEVAQRLNPDAAIAYVDVDPIAVHHSRELLRQANAPRTVTVSDVDVRDPDAVLAAPGVAGLIDFSRPVAVLMLGILDMINATREHSEACVAAFRDASVPGSALVISNGAELSVTREEMEAIYTMTGKTDTPQVTARTAEEVAALFDGYDLLKPGVVPTAAWRPEQPVTDEEAAESNCLAAVGIKRSA